MKSSTKATAQGEPLAVHVEYAPWLNVLRWLEHEEPKEEHHAEETE